MGAAFHCRINPVTELLDHFRFARLPEPAEAFRAEVRAFLAATQEPAPSDLRARSWMGFDAAFSRRLAARGWVGVTLPVHYGGANLDGFTRFVLVEELLAAGAPVSAHWTADRQSGPLILRYGTEAQRQCYLPRICKAEAFFCIGMSEPNAGSDLAGVATRAVRVDGGWRLDGRKVWTTNAHRCQYMIALVRTSGGVEDGTHGLSQFIVDLSLPGVAIRQIRDLTGGASFCDVSFENVHLADDALVGAEGAGWDQVAAEAAYERSGPERIYSSIVLLDQWIDGLRRSRRADAHAATIGRFAAHLATLRNMSIAVTGKLVTGRSPAIEAALVKDIGNEFEQTIPAVIEAAAGQDPMTPVDPELYRTLAYVSQMAPAFSLHGGTRELLRSTIARGLGLH